MSLTMQERKSVTKTLWMRYRRSSKKDKGVILNEFCEITGYNRNYASRLLRAGPRPKKPVRAKSMRKPGRAAHYGPEMLPALLKIWAGLDLACGKRVAAAMPDMLDAMIRFGEIENEPEIIGKLRAVSASTIDRLLRPERVRLNVRGRSGTKPGSLLKSKIPLRTGTCWDEARPGFVEIDTVHHCGTTTAGIYALTLDVTDIETGWSEQRAVINKAQVHVLAAMKKIRKRLPFELLGIDSDSGAEFINMQFYRYCTAENLLFTRGRPYKKNDGCHIEQKNWSIVRQNVGYARFETEEEVALLNMLYDLLRLHNNFFMPSVKLQRKIRDGSTIIKKYSDPITPYRRLLASKYISKKVKRELTDLFVTLNPIELRREIKDLQDALYGRTQKPRK